tara:strand:+ start:2198 stop:3889 length:1692 start_codon:yes stop_codon:yes gene_type:complete
MTWRNRKLFNNLPQGIVSGLEPIPRYKEGGFVNPRNYVGGGTVEYPIGMEVGSLVPNIEEVKNILMQQMQKQKQTKTRQTLMIPDEQAVDEILNSYFNSEGPITYTRPAIIEKGDKISFLPRQGEKGVPVLLNREEFEVTLKKLSMPSKENILGMEMGSLVPEVFESGDQQINDALNNALSVTGVTNDMMTKDVPKVDVAKSPQMNATDSSFDSSVETITEEYETAAKQLIQESMINPSVNQEDLEKVLEAKFTLLDEEYKTKIKELASELNMPLDQTQVETLTLFTPNFKEELDNLVETADKEIDEVISNEGPNKLIKTANIPGLEQGGLKEDDFVGQLKNQMVDSSRKKFMDLINEGNEVQMLQTGGEVDDLEKIKNLYGEFSNLPINDSLTRERMNLYRTGKLMSGKTLQGGIGGAFDVIGQSNISAGQGMGTTPETQTRISGDLLEKSLDAALGLEFPTSQALTADERREARVAEILKLPPGPVKDALLKVYGAFNKDSEQSFREEAVKLILSRKDRLGGPLYDLSTDKGREEFEKQVQLIMKALRNKPIAAEDLLNDE